MNIEILSASSAARYEEFLLKRPETLLYHSYRYHCLIEELLACQQETRLAIDESGTVRAAFPLMSMRGPYGTAFNSLPFYGSNGGLLGDDKTARAALALAYNELLSGPGVACATVVENPLSPSGATGLPVDLIDERIGQLTPLPTAENAATALMSMYHQKTRNMVRKAEKGGVAVAIDNDALDFVLDVHVQNMRDLGGIPKSDNFFLLVPKYFQAGIDYNIYVAKIENVRVAALLVFYYNKSAEYFTPVVLEAFRDTQALSGIIYRAMSDAARSGFRWWNWGGTWLSQDGVYRFKSRWGTQDKPYRYYTHIKNKEILAASRDSLLATYPNFFTVPFAALSPS